jgi:hypothetical protein
LCLALGMTTNSVTKEIKKRNVHRIEYLSGFAPHKVTPELKCVHDVLTDIHLFLHACGRNALPDGTDLGLVLRAICLDKSLKRN